MQRILISGLLFAAFAAAQPYYNLDFESVSHGRIRGWGLVLGGYELSPDESVAVSGRFSMRIRSAGVSTAGITNITLDPADLRGKRVRLSVHVKTEFVAPSGGREFGCGRMADPKGF